MIIPVDFDKSALAVNVDISAGKTSPIRKWERFASLLTINRVDESSSTISVKVYFTCNDVCDVSCVSIYDILY